MSIIKESRRIDPLELRALCIERGWFNAGTNESYSRFLGSVRDEIIDVSMIRSLAECIVENTTSEVIGDRELTSIMFDIARIAISTFEEV